MVIANFWAPFGLFGFVCMFTPVIIVITGRGKMHCARLCPRGSFVGKFTHSISLGLTVPSWMLTKQFRFVLWGVMMGTFLVLMIWAFPKGINTLAKTVLYFMEIATLLAFLTGIIFKPRSWCTICPMGYTSGKIRNFLRKKLSPKTDQFPV